MTTTVSTKLCQIASVVMLAGFFSVHLSQAETADTGTADETWHRIEDLQEKLHAEAPKGINEVEFYSPIESELHQQATGFFDAHPDDPRRWDAALVAIKTQQFPAAAEERRIIFGRNENLLKMVLASPTASAKTKQEAERAVIRQHLDHLDLITTQVQAAALESRLADYLRRFPDDPKVPNMQVRRIDLWQRVDGAKATALRDELAGSADPKVAAAARGRQAQNALGSAALDWKLPALDGATLDFARLRGKVVLVQFWASWCPDCAREMPAVLNTYRQFHERGLEIVGVSLDKDKEALLSTIKKKGIAWPQYCDGKGWENDLAVRYGVRGIPELWLVDVSGKVVATGVQADQLGTMIPPLLRKR